MLSLTYSNRFPEAGCDEAGRGCLCGPVYAAAVILPANFQNDLLNDSKKLSVHQRQSLRKIIEIEAVSWAIGVVDQNIIDEINILNASILAMHRALDQLSIKPGLILVDGNRFKPYRDIDFKCIVKGDGLYASIAAASILAKTHRDDFMDSIHREFPHYGWNKNKGYPTSQHCNGISVYGTTPYHRRSFKLNKQLKLNL